VRVDELGKERKEEERDLWIGELDQEAAPEKACPGHGPRWVRSPDVKSQGRGSIAKQPDAEEEQVGTPDVMEKGERGSRRCEHGGQPDRCGGDVGQRAQRAPGRSREPRAVAGPKPLRDDEEVARTGRRDRDRRRASVAEASLGRLAD
jgi:hypothetical protein